MSNAWLYDNQGNGAWTDLDADNELTITLSGGQSAEDFDTTAPTITSITASRTTVDVSSGAQVVSVTLTGTDASGVRWTSLSLRLNHSSDSYSTTKYSTERTIALDGGSATFYFTFLPDEVVGDYTLSNAWLYDNQGNGA